MNKLVSPKIHPIGTIDFFGGNIPTLHSPTIAPRFGPCIRIFFHRPKPIHVWSSALNRLNWPNSVFCFPIVRSIGHDITLVLAFEDSGVFYPIKIARNASLHWFFKTNCLFYNSIHSVSWHPDLDKYRMRHFIEMQSIFTYSHSNAGGSWNLGHDRANTRSIFNHRRVMTFLASHCTVLWVIGSTNVNLVEGSRIGLMESTFQKLPSRFQRFCSNYRIFF